MFRKSKIGENKLDSSLNMNLLDIESQVILNLNLLSFISFILKI